MYKRNKLQLALASILLISALGLFFGFNAFSALPAGAAGTWPTVGQGSQSENVASIQLLLQAHGYSLSADGDFG